MKLFHFISTFILIVFISIGTHANELLNSSIARGEYLARLSNCVSCHSTEDNQLFSGGLKMATPLGIIYATNITPDIETGIGSYTLNEFDKAVRLGIRKDGQRLYPAMPYTSYAKIQSDDIKDMYNYFMYGVDAVYEKNKSSEIPWILSFRWPIMIWNILFFSDEHYINNNNYDISWNRGAYIIQSMGHCGACHTPRGLAWNEKALDEENSKYLAGAFLDNWYASDLTQSNRSGLGRWSKNDIIDYLKNGRNIHSSAFGTMDEVIINSTQYANEYDLNAMASYLLSFNASQNESKYVYDDTNVKRLNSYQSKKNNGELLYIRYCADCHLNSGKGYPPYIPPLAGNPTSMDTDSASLINIVLNGSSRLLLGKTTDSYRMPGYRAIGIF